MNGQYAEILNTVIENGRVDMSQEYDWMLAELEIEIEYESWLQGLNEDEVTEAVEYAIQHIQK